MRGRGDEEMGGKDGRGRMEEGDDRRRWVVVWGHHRCGVLVPALVTVAIRIHPIPLIG